MSFPIKNGGSFHSFVYVYQRVVFQKDKSNSWKDFPGHGQRPLGQRHAALGFTVRQRFELEPAIPTAGLEGPGFAGKFGVKLGKTPKFTD